MMNVGGKRQCFERVQRKFPNCQLLSVGDGSEEEAVSKQVRVHFIDATRGIDRVNRFPSPDEYSVCSGGQRR